MARRAQPGQSSRTREPKSVFDCEDVAKLANDASGLMNAALWCPWSGTSVFNQLYDNPDLIPQYARGKASSNEGHRVAQLACTVLLQLHELEKLVPGLTMMENVQDHQIVAETIPTAELAAPLVDAPVPVACAPPPLLMLTDSIPESQTTYAMLNSDSYTAQAIFDHGRELFWSYLPSESPPVKALKQSVSLCKKILSLVMLVGAWVMPLVVLITFIGAIVQLVSHPECLVDMAVFLGTLAPRYLAFSFSRITDRAAEVTLSAFRSMIGIFWAPVEIASSNPFQSGSPPPSAAFVAPPPADPAVGAILGGCVAALCFWLGGVRAGPAGR